MPAEAAENTETLKAGTKVSATKFEMKDVLTAEGYFYVEAKNPKDFSIKDVQITSSDENCEICRFQDDRFMVVGSGQPMTVTITVTMGFEKDGTYTLGIEGGTTRKDGTYVESYSDSEKWMDYRTIVVGEKTEDKKPSSNDKGNSSSTNTNGTTKPNTTTTTATTGSSSTNKKTDDKITDSNTQKVEINKATLPKDDEVKKELEKAEEELGVDLTDDGDNVSNSKLGNILKLVAAVLGIIALAVGGFLLWKHENKPKEDDYEGAGDVDYDIEDDDIIEEDEE